MNTNNMIVGALIGTAASFVFGFLAYGILLSDFFEANMGSATGVMKSDDQMSWGPMIIGHLAWGLLIAIIFGRWAGIKTFSTGAKAGAVIGLLFSTTFQMINLATTNIMTLTGTLGDMATSTILTAITGGLVGWYFGRD